MPDKKTTQKKMSVEMLAEYLPGKFKYVANTGDGNCVVGAEPLTCVGGNEWDSRCAYWVLPFEVDIDGPWEESQRKLRPKKRRRAKEGEGYWFVDCYGEVCHDNDGYTVCDTRRWECGNYWRTEEDAQSCEDVCKALRMKIHDRDDDA